MTSLQCLNLQFWIDFAYYSSVSMADFEQVNADWFDDNSDSVLNVLLKLLKGAKVFVFPKVVQGGQFISITAQKMKFSIKDFAGNADLVTFTDEILHGKLHFLCSVSLGN